MARHLYCIVYANVTESSLADIKPSDQILVTPSRNKLKIIIWRNMLKLNITILLQAA